MHVIIDEVKAVHICTANAGQQRSAFSSLALQHWAQHITACASAGHHHLQTAQ